MRLYLQVRSWSSLALAPGFIFLSGGLRRQRRLCSLHLYFMLHAERLHDLVQTQRVQNNQARVHQATRDADRLKQACELFKLTEEVFEKKRYAIT